MATTTNYGWTTPDDTALVKDGASAIRSLGSAIDTSLNTALGTKKAGLVLLSTTTPSATTSHSVNNVFTSTYKNYLLRFNLSTIGNYCYIKLRASSTDTSANYGQAVFYSNDNSTALSFFNSAAATWNKTDGVLFTASGPTFGQVQIMSPQENTTTKFITDGYFDSGTNSANLRGSGKHNASYQADGFTIVSANNFTGTVWVYGYQD